MHLSARPARPAALSRRERAVLGVPSLVLLGVVPLVAPAWTGRALGLPAGPHLATVVRLVGLREVVVALAFLGGRSPHWLWGFVGQDAVDLPVLGLLLARSEGNRRRRLRRTLAGYLGVAAVDVTTLAAHGLRRRRR